MNGKIKTGKQNAETVKEMGDGGCLVIRDIFVHHRVDDVGDNDGLDVLEENEAPHADDRDGKTIADEEHSLVLERVTDRDGSNDETSVGENHGPPSKMEVDGP